MIEKESFALCIVRDRRLWVFENKQMGSGGMSGAKIDWNNPKLGPAYVFLAAVLFSTGGVVIKFVPWSPVAINGFRNIFACGVTGLYLWRIGHKIRLNPSVLFGALCVFLTTTTYTIATKLTTAANAVVLQYTMPVFLILFNWLFFHHRPRKLDLVTCGVIFAGIVCFFVDSLTAGGMLGNCIAVLSGVLYSGVFMINLLPGADSLSSYFFGQLFCAVSGIPFYFQETDFSLPVVGGLVMLGVFQMGLAYVILGKGTALCEPVTASLIATVDPILGPIWVAIFYGETISGLALFGAAVVILGVVGYNVINQKIIQRSQAQSPDLPQPPQT